LDTSKNIACITQYGLRGMVPADAVSPPPSRTFARSADDLIAHLTSRKASALLMSIDVDVLDPAYMRAVASPSPAGLSPESVLAGIAAAAEAGLETRLLEIMEFAPETREDPLQAFLLVQLILGALHLLVKAR
jgi:arginase family enzyme